MSAVEALAVELDHTASYAENDERALECRHPYHGLSRVPAPCAPSYFSARLFEALAIDKAAGPLAALEQAAPLEVDDARAIHEWSAEELTAAYKRAGA